MKPFFLTVASVAVLFLAGCVAETKDAPDSSKIKVDVPGVKVDVKKSSESDPHPDVKVDVKTDRTTP
jgi:hypothetical protein